MTTTTFVDKETVIEADWLNDVDEHVYDQTTDAHAASNLTNTPSGNLQATDVQGALDELQSDVDGINRIQFATVAAMVAATGVSVGDLAYVQDYATDNNSGVLFFKAVAAATGTADGGSYIDSTGSPTVQFKQNFPSVISAKMFGATGDGTTDDTTACVTALAYADESPVYFPAGTYVITSTLTLASSGTGTFSQSAQIIGAGIGKTIFDNQVSSAPLFNLSSGGTPGTNFAMGAVLKNFKIVTTTSETAQVGIKISTSYMVDISNVHIDGLVGDGVQLPTVLGDNDGSNMVSFHRVRIENCTGWGIDGKGDSGKNELSFVKMDNVFISGCGTTSAAATPPSGGMRWKGQILDINNSALTTNENCGLFIPGEAGLANTVNIQSTAFEHNKKRHIYSTGVKSFRARQIQLYNNDSYVATNGVEFDGTSFVVANVDIQGVVVRASSGNNPYTAFKISGGNSDFSTCSVRRVDYDDFGYSGQVKQSGFTDSPTVVAHKASAQSIFTTTSAMIFDTVDSDEQSIYNNANGRFVLTYPGMFEVKGKITITSPDANAPVTINLYNVDTAANIDEMILNADGVTTQTFSFNFTRILGATGLTRTYEVRAHQGSGSGTKALDVSNVGYNTLEVRRVFDGKTDGR